MQYNYDVVVVGAGSGGLTTAIGFGSAGKRVLLIEKAQLGGECTNAGCIPSKSLLHIAKTYHVARSLAGETEKLEGYRRNALLYVREKIEEVRKEETPEILKNHGVDVQIGEAKFIAPYKILVGDDEYTYKYAVIATGSVPRLEDFPGLKSEDLLTNQNLFELKSLPEKLLIIGGGPISLEMGQAFAMLGSKVTITTIDERFAKLEDEAISPLVEEKFKSLGVNILKQAFFKSAENGVATFETRYHRSPTPVVWANVDVYFDKVLVAIGRIPTLPEGLEQAGVKFDKNGILVDSQYRTSNKYIYAIGDVASRFKFTHVAGDAGRAVVARILSYGFLRVNSKKAIPKVTYTDPEIAQVGMSYQDALKKYSKEEIMRVEVPYSDSDRAKTESRTSGLLIVIARRVNGTVLGANIFGERAGELISVFTLAIDEKISLWKLRQLIYAYPTYSLLVQRAGDYFLREQLRTLKKDLLYLLKKHLPKIIAGFFWLSLLISFQHYRLSNNLSYGDLLFSLYEFFTMSMWGPIIYMFLYAVRPLILFPATLMTALSGALFGLWWGVIYTIIGENASANFAYAIGRFFGKDLRLEDGLFGKSVEWLRHRPFEFVLFMRLFYVPFDLANYGSGILKIPWTSYALATLIGILPGLTTFVALGAAVSVESLMENGITFDAFNPYYLALSVSIFIVSLFLSRILKHRKTVT